MTSLTSPSGTPSTGETPQRPGDDMPIEDNARAARALLRSRPTDAGPAWMAYAETTDRKVDARFSLGVALSEVLDDATPSLMAGAHAAGRVLAGEARKLDEADVCLSVRGWRVVECAIVGMLGNRRIEASSVGDGCIADAVLKLDVEIKRAAQEVSA